MTKLLTGCREHPDMPQVVQGFAYFSWSRYNGSSAPYATRRGFVWEGVGKGVRHEERASDSEFDLLVDLTCETPGLVLRPHEMGLHKDPRLVPG